MSYLSQRLLRYGWALMFLWFGLEQLINPSVWTGYLPEWTGYLPIPANMLVQLNGWMEVVGALFLLSGIFVKITALILSAHLFLIAWTAGGAIGVRDFVLGIMGLALATARSDPWALDYAAKPGVKIQTPIEIIKKPPVT